MMHQMAWYHGKLKSLAVPYLITGLPALTCMLGAMALVEMTHTQEEVLHYLGLSLNPASAFSWITVLAITAGAAYGTRLSTGQLRKAWEHANEPSPGTEE